MDEVRNLRLSHEYAIDAAGVMDVTHDGKTYRLVRMLKYDQWASVVLMECEGELHVLKISCCRGPLEWLLRPLMAFVSGHEYRLYNECDGLAGVPPLGPQVTKYSYMHVYIEGVTLDQNSNVEPEFFDQLDEIVRQIHERDVAYVDLAKRENIIVGDDGKPYLIDFQVSLCRKSGWGPFTWFQNLLVRTFQREDRDHVLKHRDRILRARIPGYVQQYHKRRGRFARFHRTCLRGPYLFVKRLFIPKHGDTTFFR